MNRPQNYYLSGLIILWLLVHTFLIQHYGFRELEDGVSHIKGADYLLKYKRLEDTRHIFYLTTISLIAVFRWIFPGQIMPFIFAQCILSGVAMVSLYFSSVKIFNTKLAGFITGLVFLLWWDNIHWNTTTMTESLSCSVTCFIIYCLVFFKDTVKDYVIIILLVIVITFTRPTGVITFVGVVSFFLYYYWQQIMAKPVLKFGIPVLLLLIGLGGSYIMFSRWDFSKQLKAGNIVTYMNQIEGTPLYEESLHLPSNNIDLGDPDSHPMLKMASYVFFNPGHFVKTASLKIWYLISFYRPYYSTAHNFLTMSWTFLIYILFFFGFRNTLHPIKVFAATVIIVNCALIGIATVDWDNRFFIPMEPGIVLLVGGGGALLYKRLISFLVKLF